MTRPALPLGTLNAGEGSLHPPISNVLVEEVRDGYGSEDLQQMVTVRALCVTENNLNDVWTASTAEASSLPAKARSLARGDLDETAELLERIRVDSFVARTSMNDTMHHRECAVEVRCAAVDAVESTPWAWPSARPIIDCENLLDDFSTRLRGPRWYSIHLDNVTMPFDNSNPATPALNHTWRDATLLLTEAPYFTCSHYPAAFSPTALWYPRASRDHRPMAGCHHRPGPKLPASVASKGSRRLRREVEAARANVER
ncbi:hypothetical protein EV121DRAFT_274767 [Schizophyllum commune]